VAPRGIMREMYKTVLAIILVPTFDEHSQVVCVKYIENDSHSAVVEDMEGIRQELDIGWMSTVALLRQSRIHDSRTHTCIQSIPGTTREQHRPGRAKCFNSNAVAILQ